MALLSALTKAKDELVKLGLTLNRKLAHEARFLQNITESGDSYDEESNSKPGLPHLIFL